jgi:Flp pilus assembly protein CpaB
LSTKAKAIFIIFAGIILVAVGVFASYLLIQSFQVGQAPAEPEFVQEEVIKTDVVVVTRDLFLGDRITEADLELASIPVENAPRTAIPALEGAIGKIIKSDLVQGQMVLSHNLADPTNNNQDLSFILSEDHVLLAFPADDLMSRENMVQRGDIIDIFASFTVEITTDEEPDPETGEEPEPKTRIFTIDSLQRVDVTALVVDVIEEEETGANLLPGQTAQEVPARVTNIRAYLLALNPQDALILKYLKDIGAIFDIVLRAPTSTAQFELTPVTEEFIIEFYGLEILP